MATAKKKIEMLPRDSDKEAKKKALNTAIAQLEKDFGVTILNRGSDLKVTGDIEAVSAAAERGNPVSIESHAITETSLFSASTPAITYSLAKSTVSPP